MRRGGRRGRKTDDAGGGDGDSADEEGDQEGPICPWRLGWALAGIVGVHPGQWTLRQLAWASYGKQREAWNHTASLLASHAEANRDPKKRYEPYTSKDFHPFEEVGNLPEPEVPEISDELLKEFF